MKLLFVFGFLVIFEGLSGKNISQHFDNVLILVMKMFIVFTLITKLLITNSKMKRFFVMPIQFLR